MNGPAPQIASAVTVLDDVAGLADQLRGAVAAVRGRGRTAQGVADVLRAAGVDASVPANGMRGWIETLQGYPADLDPELEGGGNSCAAR